ncbi:hypothetical protein CHLNCDRAFT_145502 [Chlorella variabilis]|uniref:Leucine-rich repeat-containing N-terminal plant-type domain-containing protein n=1 Tax=Chlorella variabilis TaxID=554065 RepID=E1ZDM5_CHLVA|nr:hypothetical protein CHLNCDRAFT_145502 [Chlorella variabilis]EFN55885.1 hypothetical protein CHLNCDRAFT_145502 [Chlorella variabilis]|eukprot:XP_005847987.1 hypothetical protein CHLNCDRAFT_145502 [Chlorella variabilis]
MPLAVDLSRNQLSGTLSSLEAGLGDAPPFHLQLLNLSGNAFTGTLPPSWLRDDAWPIIHYIDVSKNDLEGPINIPSRRAKRQFSL